MHFNTASAKTGDTALLESRLLYPKRGFQCLQFFYYNSADPEDTLKIYVREYDKAHPNGTLRFIRTIDGDYLYILLGLKICQNCAGKMFGKVLPHVLWQEPLRICGSCTTWVLTSRKNSALSSKGPRWAPGTQQGACHWTTSTFQRPPAQSLYGALRTSVKWWKIPQWTNPSSAPHSHRRRDTLSKCSCTPAEGMATLVSCRPMLIWWPVKATRGRNGPAPGNR